MGFIDNVFSKITGFFNTFIKTDFIYDKGLEDLIKEILINTSVKPVKISDIVEKYSVKNMVKIVVDRKNDVYRYIVVEPELNHEVEELVVTLYRIDPNCTSQYCISKILDRVPDPRLSEVFSSYPLETTYYYLKVSSGYGALYPLIIDPWVEEIAGSSRDNVVSIIHRKYSWFGWMDTNIPLNPREADRLVLSLARRAGKHLSLTYPIAEGLTPEGMRISLMYGEEVSRKGSSFVIRKKPPRIVTITELIDKKTITALAAAYLWLILELKGFIMVIGGMSTGKTTLLQALLTLIPPTRRVVTIEDTPELMGSTGKWDPLVERISSLGGEDSIDLFKLLKFSLRRRADYIVVGEVRGKEARLLVQASRLGHGIMATMHGDDASTVIERLMAPPISIPRPLLSNIWCIVVMDNVKGERRVRRIYEIDRGLRFHEVLDCTDRECNPSSVEELVEKSIRLQEVLGREVAEHELAQRVLMLQRLVDYGVFSPDLLGEELIRYYTDMGEEVEKETTS